MKTNIRLPLSFISFILFAHPSFSHVLKPIMCNTYYEGGAQGLHLRHGSQPERVPSIHGTPQLQPWWGM